ncbi:MAG: uridine kinase [Acidocella sp.]|uniref:uridine kinase family protein n=1 Tax=Acidocella sp. TaxID=50710 RepID=UPI003FD7F1DA
MTRPLIAIDGLPCAGKTTLAMRLQEIHGFECLHVDEFLRPEDEWHGSQPAFPFPYIRYEEFLQAVTDLAEQGECSYAPYDWKTLAVSTTPRRITTHRPVIVEGISALVPLLEPYYGLKIFVDSDRRSIQDVARTRSLGIWLREWREIFLPSADMYMLTRPERRADMIVPGRGKTGEITYPFNY